MRKQIIQSKKVVNLDLFDWSRTLSSIPMRESKNVLQLYHKVNDDKDTLVTLIFTRHSNTTIVCTD